MGIVLVMKGIMTIWELKKTVKFVLNCAKLGIYISLFFINNNSIKIKMFYIYSNSNDLCVECVENS